WMTYISLPGSPSRKRTSPRLNSLPKRWNSASSPAMKKSYQRSRAAVNLAARDGNHSSCLLLLHAEDSVPARRRWRGQQAIAARQHQRRGPISREALEQRIELQARFGELPRAIRREPARIAVQERHLSGGRRAAQAKVEATHRLRVALHPGRRQLAHRLGGLVVTSCARGRA